MGIYSKKEPISVKYGLDDKVHDSEGRCITLEYSEFYLITACKFFVPFSLERMSLISFNHFEMHVFQYYIHSIFHNKIYIGNNSSDALVTGDFIIEYELTKDRRLKVRGYYKNEPESIDIL